MDSRSVEPFPDSWAQDGALPSHRFRSLPRSMAWEPGVDEATLWRELTHGDLECWRRLLLILREQDRLAEVGAFRERLATTASQEELTRLVALSSSAFDVVSAARFQVELVTRFSADATGLEHCARLLAETGAYDRAMAVQREALRRGTDRRYFMLHPLSTMRALTGGDRWDDAEELMRAYAGEMMAASPLALLLQVRGRTAEGEQLLRGHPHAAHLWLRFTLFTLLERGGRHAEAAGVRPADGWPPQMRGVVVPRPGFGDSPHESVWWPADLLGRAFAV